MSLADYYASCAIPKPEPRKREKARADRQDADRTVKIRAYVFGRERGLCRVCRLRDADSMHELRPRSIGGKVSRANSVAVCGDGVNGCHGFAQRNEIRYAFEHDGLGADSTVTFTATSEQAAEWLQIVVGESISSPPMIQTEIDA